MQKAADCRRARYSNSTSRCCRCCSQHSTVGVAAAVANAVAAASVPAAAVLVCRVPGLKTKLTAADMAVLDAGNISWVSDVQLLAQQQLLLVMFQVRTVHM